MHASNFLPSGLLTLLLLLEAVCVCVCVCVCISHALASMDACIFACFHILAPPV